MKGWKYKHEKKDHDGWGLHADVLGRIVGGGEGSACRSCHGEGVSPWCRVHLGF